MNEQLHVYRYGIADGPPLLAIHGVSAHGRRFETMAPLAFPSYRVIAPDLRGHGRSPAGHDDEPVRIENHLHDLLRILDDENVAQAVVVGHSFGGCLGTHLLAHAPERVSALVLLDPAIGLPSQQTTQLGDLMIAGDRRYQTLDDLIHARRAGRSAQAVAHSDADTRLAAVKDPKGWRTPWDPAVVRASWEEMSRPLPHLAVRRPTLLLDATQAQLVGPIQHAHFSAQLGDTLEVDRMDLGHMLYWDDFDAVCARISRFLESPHGALYG